MNEAHAIKDMHPLAELAEEAFEHATPYHRAQLNEVSNYRNTAITGREQYGIDCREIGGALEFPQSGEIVDRLVPAFKAELARVELRPQEMMESDDDPFFVETLGHILESHEEAGNESLINESMILHFLVCGNFVSKIVYDEPSHTIVAPVIAPWSFAPAPDCDIDLDSADYAVHRTYHTNDYTRHHFPDAPLKDNKDEKNNRGENVHDEIWLKADYARMIDTGIKDIGDKVNMVVAWNVNGEPQKAIQDPIAYPSFPFVKASNYPHIDPQKGLSFWGTGYTERSRAEEIAYNNFLSAYLDIASELPHNRLLTTEGAIPVNSILNIPGSIIQLQPGKTLQDVEALRSEPPPPSLLDAIALLRQGLQEKSISLSDVFVGKSPGGNASGKAIISLQGATYNQISGKVGALNEGRRKRVEVRTHTIQSKYELPVQPNQWRYTGRIQLPEDARFVAFDAVVPDDAGIPNTLAGRLTLLQTLGALGVMLKPERLTSFLKLDSSFGLGMDDLVPIPQQSQQPVNNEALAGMM